MRDEIVSLQFPFAVKKQLQKIIIKKVGNPIRQIWDRRDKYY
tara:strand:+ start:3494 stop:3619 length:126 start_codon:yes stop_codon:yes gene_type:complete